MSEAVFEIDFGMLPEVIPDASLLTPSPPLPEVVEEAGGLEKVLARLLGEIGQTPDSSTLDDRGLLDAIIEEERLSRVHAARRTRLIAELHRRRPGDEPGIGAEDTAMVFPMSRWAPDELGLALSMSRLTAKNTLREAARLAVVLPDMFAAFDQGLIDSYRARIIHDTTLCLTDEQAREVEALVLADAGEQTYS